MRLLREPLLNSVPEVLFDDPQVRHVGVFPIFARFHTADALAGGRIEHHPHPVPDKNAGVDCIAKDAVAPIGATVQRGGVPLHAPRRQDALCVQIVGDQPGRISFRVFLENSPDHISLMFHNLKLARFPKDRRVAIGLATGTQALAYVSDHPAMDLFTEILEEQRAHKAANADLYLVLHTFIGRDDVDFAESQQF
nr:hypothetical protein [Halovulum marinum]